MGKENQVLNKVANEAATKENIIDYLNVVKNNLNLSVLNQAMVYLQNPAAKKVCGKKAWESMGRTINKNSTPIVLLRPSITIKEQAEEFTIDDCPQVVGETDVIMNTKEAVYINNYIPVNAFDLNSTTGDAIPDETMANSFSDAIICITGITPEGVDTKFLGTEKSKYDKEQNAFYYNNDIDLSTVYGKQEYNKAALSAYVDYIFNNYNIEDQILKKAVLYVLYEHYNFKHRIEKPAFRKLDEKSQNEKLEFLSWLQYFTGGITQDFDGYYLNFNETAFVNDVLCSSDLSRIWIDFDKVSISIDDTILKDEIDTLKSKLGRIEENHLKNLLFLRAEKKLYSYPPKEIMLDKTDYLREERLTILT